MKSKFLRLVLLVSIVLIILARFHVSLVRFFDPDEFAHLHWAWLVAQGKLPYKDFFFYATPMYQWFLWPLFQLPSSETVLVLARLWQFSLYGLFLFLLYCITLHVTRLVTVGLLTILLFVTFPMTFDKTIDIRPDVLMTVLYFVAVDLLLTSKKFLLAGLLIGVSFLVFFKIIYALPAAILLVFIRPPLTKPTPQGVALSKLGIGFFLPLGLFALYLFANNLHLPAWEAFSHTQFVVNTGKEPFSLLATLSPWPLVYVSKDGVSFPWLVNMGIWLAALGGLLVVWRKHKNFALFATLFSLSAIFFLFLFPAPYVQYFIPLSVIASILAAILLNRFSLIVSLVLVASFFLQYRERIAPASNNAEQLQVVGDVLTISKPTDTFYDMVGSYVFRPDGYFVCCHPYAEFVDKLKTKPPALAQSLISKNTKFLIMDRTGQSLWKPKKEDLDFLKVNFKPSSYLKIYIRN